jgi:hypothetical protein
MKRLGASGSGMQFTAAKKNSQQAAPKPPARSEIADAAMYASHKGTGSPVRERIIEGGGGTPKSVCVCPTYGRGANDGFKPSERKKVW